MKFLQILWKTTVLDPSRPNKASMPLALSHSKREWGLTVLQHRWNTRQLQHCCPTEQRCGTEPRTTEGAKEHVERALHRERRQELCAKNGGIQGMEEAGRKSGFVSSVTQEKFLFLSKPCLKLYREGERTIWRMLRKAEFNISLQQHRCCFTRNPGWGRTGRHWGNEELESRVQSKDIRQKSKGKRVTKGVGKSAARFLRSSRRGKQSHSMLQWQRQKPLKSCSWRGFGGGVTQREKKSQQAKKGRQYMEKVHQGRNEPGFSAQGSSSG